MTHFKISLLLLVLSGPLAFGQESRRTGIVGAASAPRAQIANASELHAAGLLPEGYAYTFTGKHEGKSYVIHRIHLVSPEGTKQISLERVEDTFVVRRRPLPSAKLLINVQGTERQLERNRGSQLDRYLDAAVYSEGPGNFSLRGWAITRTQDTRSKRSLLLDGIDVKVNKKGLDHVWAERVYDGGKTVLLEPIRSISQGVKRKHVKVNRYALAALQIPPFHGQLDDVQRRGTIGRKRAPTSIANCAELRSLGVFTDGYAYVFDGSAESKKFVVDRIALVSPDEKRKLSLARFEGVYTVRKTPQGRLVLTHEGVDHRVEKNSGSKLDRYLAQAVQAGGAGDFKVRGWLIATSEASGESHALLLDGVEVKVEREGLSGVWAERVFDAGKTVLLESSGRLQRGIKSRFVEVVRRAPRAGMTSALSAKSH